ncbi:MAG: TetR/AcrR family transcriptional regulator [Chloroflexota bacterium]
MKLENVSETAVYFTKGQMKRKRKVSRQVLRTRRLLQEALVNLIQEQDYATLRVEDITERADVGRATFYIHYKDKDDLLKTVVDGFHEEVVARLVTQNNPHDMVGLQDALEHARQKPQFYQVVLAYKPSRERIHEFIVARVTKRLLLFGVVPSEKINMVAHFVAGAVMGMLRWWLATDDTTSAEEASQFVQSMIAQGLPATLASEL